MQFYTPTQIYLMENRMGLFNGKQRNNTVRSQLEIDEEL